MFYFLSSILFFCVALISNNIKYGFFSVFFLYIFTVIIKKNSFNDNKFLFNFVLLLFFFILVLIFKDDNLIKFKTSILYFFLSLFFFISYFYKKFYLKEFLAKNNLILPTRMINFVNLSFCLFFLFLSCLNIYVSFTYSTTVWLIFKTFGCSFLLFFFVLFIYKVVFVKK